MGRKKNRIAFITTAVLAVLVLGTVSAFAQQASITLVNCAGELCQNNNTDWSLTKVGSYDQTTGKVTWAITATRGATTDNFIKVNGFVTVKNTGSANATIGNIVVNLQKPTAPNTKVNGKNVAWVSVAADCASAFSGDIATSCNIVSGASQENQTVNNSLQGANNYSIAGATGTFTETAASGPLEFLDANNNTAFSITPQISLPAGQQIDLLYTATFDNSILNLPTGTSLRWEVLVGFGNAGSRGGSGDGVSASNIDVNGSGLIDADEANVRTVPCRVTRSLPALEKSNDKVTLSDTDPPDITKTGTVAYSNFSTNISGPGSELISLNVGRSVSVDVDGGTGGGTITNTAHLDGTSSSVTVTVTNPVTLVTTSYTFACCVGIHLDKGDTVAIGPNAFNPPDGSYCTYTQGGWGANPSGNNPGKILSDNFATVYPGGSVEVGIIGSLGFSMKFTADTVLVCTGHPVPTCVPTSITPAQAIALYLPANGSPGALDADLTDPTSSSSGVFGGQVLALQLNVDFNTAGVTVGTGGNLGILHICNFAEGDSLLGTPLTATQATALNFQSINAVLAEANTVLGGGTGSFGLTIPELNELVDYLNNAFDGCTTNNVSHLCQ